MGSKWENAELVDIHDMCDSTTISSIKCLTVIDDKNNRKQRIVYYKDSFTLCSELGTFCLGYGKKQCFSSQCTVHTKNCFSGRQLCLGCRAADGKCQSTYLHCESNKNVYSFSVLIQNLHFFVKIPWLRRARKCRRWRRSRESKE